MWIHPRLSVEEEGIARVHTPDLFRERWEANKKHAPAHKAHKMGAKHTMVQTTTGVHFCTRIYDGIHRNQIHVHFYVHIRTSPWTVGPSSVPDVIVDVIQDSTLGPESGGW